MRACGADHPHASDLDVATMGLGLAQEMVGWSPRSERGRTEQTYVAGGGVEAWHREQRATADAPVACQSR